MGVYRPQTARATYAPKGDPAGSWLTIGDHTLVIGERPGNKRADGLLNLIENPHVGLLFLVTGRGDTLRINGRAKILRDAPYFDTLAMRGQTTVSRNWKTTTHRKSTPNSCINRPTGSPEMTVRAAETLRC